MKAILKSGAVAPALLFCLSTLAVGAMVSASGIPSPAAQPLSPKTTTPTAIYGAQFAPAQPRLATSIWLNRLGKLFQASTAESTPTIWSTVPNQASAGGLELVAKVLTARGAIDPGQEFPIVLEYKTGDTGAAAATIELSLHEAAVYERATPAAASGNGTAASPLTFTLAALAPNSSGKIIVEARAKTLQQDPEVMWKDISSRVVLKVAGQSDITLKTRGPKVTTLKTARLGDRPFPVVMVQYQDIKHCTGADERGGLPTDPNDTCVEAHTATTLDAKVNSKTSGSSLYQLYQDMSFGQIYPNGLIAPAADTPDTNFDPAYVHKFSALAPGGACVSGVTLAAAHGTPVYAKRIEGGWYTLPGNQAYYGSDKAGPEGVKGQAGAPNQGIDDACGPIAKVVYDAASLADPDIDYNDFDTDKDGTVDFFNLMFAGDGGNGNLSTTGLNNVWPHKTDLRAYYTDADGQTGYVSNDQLKNHFDQPLYWKTAARQQMTTDPASGIKVFVQVGPYNVNPEDANEFVSVVGHEYGHSLNLPDYYSTTARETFGTWNLMATDYFHFYPAYDRARLGWIVPRKLQSGEVSLRESKTDTGEIHWARPDGTPYVLRGEGIHNGDVYKVNLPTALLIDTVPSGSHAWFSGSGNDFGCPGHYLDVFLPAMAQTASASAVTLKFKSLYEMEWDYDYGFVLVSTDDGKTFTSLASKNGTTIASNFNPNTNGCLTNYNNGITGVSGDGANNAANPHRQTSVTDPAGINSYPPAAFIDDEFDMSSVKGKSVVLRFAYSTDPGLAKRGWFIDDVTVTADDKTIYSSDFEGGREPDSLFPRNWQLASTTDGVDTEHAYYLELRDRLSNDFDGKGEAGRGTPTWEPGVSLLITDENHGYGNTGVDDPPAQSPVDSNPVPGADAPNLDDAAFTLTRPSFNGCTHIDNYTDAAGPDGMWKLPGNLKFTVTAMSNIVGAAAMGVAPATPGSVTLLAEVNPDCTLQLLPPELSIASGYEDPDSNGNYNLSWTRPAGSVGPDTLQEATVFATLLEDDAEGGLGKWVATTTGTGAMNWAANTLKKRGGSNSFRGTYTNGSDGPTPPVAPPVEPPTPRNAPAALLTLKDAIAIPSDGETKLSYWDFFINEGDDSVILEATADDGATWDILNQSNRSELAPDAAPAVASEALSQHVFSLAAYAGRSIKLRYRMQSGGEDRAGSVPFGWFVDDIKVETSNFKDLLVKTPATAAAIAGRGTGAYFYRVKTAYPAFGSSVLPSDYSNVVMLTVKDGVVAVPTPGTGGNPTPVPGIGGVAPITSTARGGRFGGSLGGGLLILLAAGAALRRRRIH